MAKQTPIQPKQKQRTAPQGSKICPVCQRPFQNRKAWAQRGIWDQVVYCSERCRRAAKRQR